MKRTVSYATIITAILATVLVVTGIATNASFYVGATAIDVATRLLVLAGVVMLITAHRPRSGVLRAMLGVIGAVVFFVATAEAALGILGVLDGVLYAIGAYFILMEALEPTVEPVGRRSAAIHMV